MLIVYIYIFLSKCERSANSKTILLLQMYIKQMKSKYQLEIINRIRQLREERNYSQWKIATLLGISTGQMGSIESRRAPHKYTLAQIYSICVEFDYPIEHLFLEESDYTENRNIIATLISKIVMYEKR